MATYYEVLGVTPEASPAELRQAYVSLARAVHPDRGAGDPRRMQEINEAWRVLRDPAGRRAYDEAVRPAPPVDPMDVPFAAPPAEPGDLGVAIARALPWVAILAVLGLIFVVTAVAGGGGGDENGGDDLVGRCVTSGPGSTVVPVPCSAPNDGRVVLLVDRPSLCPDRADGRAVDDDRWLCLEQVGP